MMQPDEMCEIHSVIPPPPLPSFPLVNPTKINTLKPALKLVEAGSLLNNRRGDLTI